MPWPAVWEHYCASDNTPAGIEWLDTVRDFEKKVLSRRGAGK